MTHLNPVELIIRKRDGGMLTAEEIAGLIKAYTNGEIPDYQMSAFLMAAFLRGLDPEETSALTDAMLYSGEVLDLSDIPGIKVDKHSTGGVGDKVSLILAPIVAACGVPVPMISGRGLGHTGGTLDKLESIPGFRVDVSIDEYQRLLREHGAALIGQTAEIAPADRKLYALRDVTGTIEFIPFIAASIMSKKLAEGIDALVLDVKCGRGAFMKTEPDARKLAETLVDIGERFGKKTVAWVTRMDVPLGRAIGNWPEVEESIRCLQGENVPDLMDVTTTLAGEMLCLGGAAATPDEGWQRAQQAIDSGEAFEKFVEIVEAQHGDARVVRQPSLLHNRTKTIEITAPDGFRGYVADLDAHVLGRTAVLLGAGRLRKEDPVNPAAGIVLNKSVGDYVEPGELLATLYTDRTDLHEQFSSAVRKAYSLAEVPAPQKPVLIGRYTSDGWVNPF